MRDRRREAAARTLARWWPPNAAPAARRWIVDRRSDGIFTAASSSSTPRSRASPRSAVLHRGQIRFAGVDLGYDDRLPPVTDAGGKVQLDDRGWTLRADGGRVGTIQLAGASGPCLRSASSRPAAPHRRTSWCDREALAILDQEPFGYARALGITPADVTGAMTARPAIDSRPAASQPPVALSGTAP